MHTQTHTLTESFFPFCLPRPPPPSLFLSQRLTAQSLTEKMGEDARNRDLVAAANGVEALIDICTSAADDRMGSDDDLTLYSLEALRQLIRDHPPNKSRLGEAGGVELSLRFIGARDKPALQEASLALLLSLAVDCEVNCRRILKTGLDLLIHAAETGHASSLNASSGSSGGGASDASGTTGGRSKSRLGSSRRSSSSSRSKSPSRKSKRGGGAGSSKPGSALSASAGNVLGTPKSASSLKGSGSLSRSADLGGGGAGGGGGGGSGPEDSKSRANLAQELLRLLGPYSWIECANCSQLNPGGSVCGQCGHPIEFSY